MILKGVGEGCVKAPVYKLSLNSELVTGYVCVVVCAQLPVEGVKFILGNDLADGQVFPHPVVVNNPRVDESGDTLAKLLNIFPACVVTRAQARKWDEVVDLSHSFLQAENVSLTLEMLVDAKPSKRKSEYFKLCEVSLQIGHEQLAAAQKADPSLVNCIEAATDKIPLENSKVTYFWENGILMRLWKNDHGLRQVVVPTGYPFQILSLAHNNMLSRHVYFDGEREREG